MSAGNAPGVAHLHCHRFGDPSGPALLLLHGFLGSGADFAALLAHLGNRVHGLAPDLPGHGRTRLPTNDPAWSVEGCADAILRWLDAAGIETPHLLGYSLGGRIALRLAIDSPARFGAIIIESASPGIDAAEERTQRRQRDAQLAVALRAGTLERFVDDWYAQPLFASLAGRADFGELRRRRLRQDPVGLAHALERMSVGAQQSLWPRLRDLARPLHLAVGGADAKYRTIAARVAQLAPQSQVRVFDGAGHNVHHEQPERFAEYLLEVLADHGRGPT